MSATASAAAAATAASAAAAAATNTIKKPLLRIPYTGPLPPPVIVPRSANTVTGAVAALRNFLRPPSPPSSSSSSSSSSSGSISTPPRTTAASTSSPRPRDYGGVRHQQKTVVLSGAGISVASGLADYRGETGTYTLNKTYRPIYYGEFVGSHEARKRYWARSFLGWPTLYGARPNATHRAVKQLGEMGIVSSVVTQNVDSFHPQAHPELQTIELHGFLRSTVCVQCRNLYPRDEFQGQLAKLNPAWAEFLEEMIESGALTTEDPEKRRKLGYRSNPDGDVDVPNAPYTTFRYPPCPKCLERRPKLADGSTANVEMDSEGAWDPVSNAGVLKPAVIMFGESISSEVKTAAERAVDEADRLLVMGSSLATYSAYRLVKRALDQGKPIGVLNKGGIRGEDMFFSKVGSSYDGSSGVRCSLETEKVLPALVEALN